MKTTVTKSKFIEAFKDIRPDNFTDDGLSALFNYLEQLESGQDDELDLDVIGFCCEFTEFKNLEEFNSAYGANCQLIEDVYNYTSVIEIDNSESFIITDF